MWQFVWRFPGPLPTHCVLKDPLAVPVQHRDLQIHGNSEIVQGSLDAFPNPRSIASKSVYPRLILLCLQHNLAKPLHILLSAFGIPETSFVPHSGAETLLLLGTGIDGITLQTSGTYWRYRLREGWNAAESIASKFGGRNLNPELGDGGQGLEPGQGD